MPASITLTRIAPAHSPGIVRSIAAAGRRATLAALALARIALLAFLAYSGGIIVRHVTQALCALTGHTQPAWTSDR